MDCKVKWTGDGMSFIAETGTNHTVVMDGAIEAGGATGAASDGANACWRRWLCGL
jgi:uncharacterized OsmC-like protein